MPRPAGPTANDSRNAAATAAASPPSSRTGLASARLATGSWPARLEPAACLGQPLERVDQCGVPHSQCRQGSSMDA